MSAEFITCLDNVLKAGNLQICKYIFRFHMRFIQDIQVPQIQYVFKKLEFFMLCISFNFVTTEIQLHPVGP